jgi:hypothetical protein
VGTSQGGIIVSSNFTEVGLQMVGGCWEGAGIGVTGNLGHGALNDTKDARGFRNARRAHCRHQRYSLLRS